MSIILYKTAEAYEDEIFEINEKLELSGIDFYQVERSLFNIPSPGFYVQTETDLNRGLKILEQYSCERQKRVRAEFKRDVESGRELSFFGLFKRRPIHVSLFLLSAVMMVALATLPFWWGI